MPPTIFVSHSHKDEAWKDRVVGLFEGLEVEAWDDLRIGAGSVGCVEMEAALSRCQAGMLLVSPPLVEEVGFAGIFRRPTTSSPAARSSSTC